MTKRPTRRYVREVASNPAPTPCVRPSLAEDACDEAYAQAMVDCQGYAPACSGAQECLYDGFCFKRDGYGFAEARKIIRDAINRAPSVYTRSWLKLGLDALDHHQFLARGAFDALRLVAINKAVRREYGMQEPERPKPKRKRR